MNKYLKIIYLTLYFVVFRIIPGIGVSWDISDPVVLFLEYLFFSVLAFYFFRVELSSKRKKINFKLLTMFNFIHLLIILGVYLLGKILLGIEIGVEQYPFDLLFLFRVCFLGSFVEEMTYRYCFITSKSTYFKLGQTLLSCVLFSYSHVASENYPLLLLVPVFITGLYCSLIFIVKKNIWYSISAHVFFNVIVMISSYYVT